MLEAAVFVGGNIGAGSGYIVSDDQNVARCKAFDRIFIRIDRIAGTYDAVGEAITILSAAIVDLGSVLDSDLDRRAGDRQGTEIIGDRVIACLGSVPLDRIGILGAARVGDRSVRRSRRRFAFNQSFDGRLGIRQRRTVIGLIVGSRGNRDRLRTDLQATGTDKQADAVVRIARQICLSEADGILVITGISIRDCHIAQSCGAILMSNSSIVGTRYGSAVDSCPNVIEVFFRIPLVADHDIIRNALPLIGEAGLFEGTVINDTGPAVGLDTNVDVDLLNFQSAADIANGVVIRVRMAGNHGGFGRDRGDTRVESAVVIRCVIRIRIIELNTGERIAVLQAFYLDLSLLLCGELQGNTIIRFFIALGGDDDLLLIEESEGQPAGGYVIGDLVIRACGGPAICGAFHSLVELPAGYRRTS